MFQYNFLYMSPTERKRACLKLAVTHFSEYDDVGVRSVVFCLQASAALCIKKNTKMTCKNANVRQAFFRSVGHICATIIPHVNLFPSTIICKFERSRH